MFTVFIDDSGTDPRQRVAIASALIVPTRRILALEREWNTLRERESFDSFHSSACVSRNPKKEFAGWSDEKLHRVLKRVREISKKYGTKVFSLAVNKKDYDDDSVVNPELREFGRYHYTWAVRLAIAHCSKWADERGIHNPPLEYVFDFMDDQAQKQAKIEIEVVMTQAELLNPGRFAGHYSFGKRCEVPALQCTDLIAWTCYQFALHKFVNAPLSQIAAESFADYEKKGPDWFFAVAQTREQLSDWAVREMADPRSQKRRHAWRDSQKLERIKR